jgi:hypothetical protein
MALLLGAVPFRNGSDSAVPDRASMVHLSISGREFIQQEWFKHANPAKAAFREAAKTPQSLRS